MKAPVLILLGCGLSEAQADLVLRGGRVWTGDPSRPWADSAAVKSDRILAVGAFDRAWMEDTKGRLTPGQLADLVVLSQDLFQVDPIQIHQTRALLALAGGREVQSDSQWGRGIGGQ